MIYLKCDELVRNIHDQTERAAAVIGHIDALNFNPNTVIIPFLGNIFDSAMIVTALEINSDPQADCHRNAFAIVMVSSDINSEIKRFIKVITELRKKYSEYPKESAFDPDDCLDFLNAYDCFMFNFIKTSRTVIEMNKNGSIDLRFSSFRNMMEKILKKNIKTRNDQTKSNDFNAELVRLLVENNRLLNENNRLLEKILEKIDLF